MLHLCSALSPRLCLELYLPFFPGIFAMLYFYLLWLLRLKFLTLTYSGCSIRFCSYNYICLFGPVRELWKKYNFLFTIRPDSTDSTDSADLIFGYRFDSDFIGYSLFCRSVRWGSNFDYSRLQFIINYLFKYERVSLSFAARSALVW